MVQIILGIIGVFSFASNSGGYFLDEHGNLQGYVQENAPK